MQRIVMTFLSQIVSSISINHPDMKKKKVFLFCEPQLSITKTGHDIPANLLCFHICDASTGCGTEKSLLYNLYV